MRSVGFSFAIVVLFASSVMAATGDTWILGIDHIENSGFFQTYTGAGYSGSQASGDAQYVGNAYGPKTGGPYQDAVARIFWSLSGLSTNGHALPTTTELYSVKFYGTAQPGNSDWQPIEVDFNGSAPGNGEGLQDPNIPWAGQYGTNHQWIAADHKTVGAWNITGPGPQAPSSPAYNASGFDGNYMWLNSGSWLYAKWNLGFNVNRSWSAIELTQYTPVAGPPPVGDYNTNNVVDAADYVLWRKTFDDVNAISGRPADGNHDGYVDYDDYDIWRRHFGEASGSGAGSAVVAIPEPATLSLTLLAAVVCLAALMRRRDLAVGHTGPVRTHNCDK